MDRTAHHWIRVIRRCNKFFGALQWQEVSVRPLQREQVFYDVVDVPVMFLQDIETALVHKINIEFPEAI